MSPESTDAIELARRLCAAGGVDPGCGAADFAVHAADLTTGLRRGLVRWAGTDGYRALFDRAIRSAQVDHPALAGLTSPGGDERETMASTVAVHGTDAVMLGLIALIAELTDVLGRIVGEQMAAQLVEQLGTPSPRGVVSTQLLGGRDG